MFPLLAGLVLIFDVKGGFMAGLALVIPYPLVAFFLYALIKNDIRRFVAEVRACGTPKYQLYRNDTGFFAGPTFDVVGARYADFANTYRVGSYSLLGLRVGIERDRWTVFGQVRNLLDEHYVGVLTVRDVAAPDDALLQAGEPRSVYAGVRYRF